MRVGLDLLFLEEQSGGSGTYARELIPGLLERGVSLTAFLNAEAPAWFAEQPWSDEVRQVRLPLTVTHGPPHNFAKILAASWLTLPRRARGLDLVHGLANAAPLMGRSVVTVLDLIWLRHETLERRIAKGMELIVRASARRADRVLAISHAARADLVSTLRLDPAKVAVTPLGIRLDPVAATPEAELRARLGLGDRPVILSVGAKRHHKNQAALIRALPAGAVLVLAGPGGPAEPELRAAATDAVVLCDWLSREDLEGLYALAAGFALPSLEEGFGLPVLEAMARGVPVACSNRSSLPEVAGDAALLFDPDDDAAIAAALRRLLSDPVDLGARGRARAAAFPWSATADATVAAYETVCTSA